MMQRALCGIALKLRIPFVTQALFKIIHIPIILIHGSADQSLGRKRRGAWKKNETIFTSQHIFNYFFDGALELQ